VHLWELARGDYDWMSPDLGAICRDFSLRDVEPLLQNCGVDQVVVVQAAATLAETRYLLALARSSATIAGVVGWVDFESPQSGEQLRELCSDPKFKGVRPMIQFQPDLRWLLRPDVAGAWSAVAAANVPVDFLVAPEHLDPLSALLDQRPELVGVIDHAAKPQIARSEFQGWAQSMTRLARSTRVVCKLSGLATEAGPQWSVAALQPYVDLLLAEFGPSRLMFGSDWPVLNLAGDYLRWFEAANELLRALSADQRAAIFGTNAVAFYRL
jgi:L-fuconolactonase